LNDDISSEELQTWAKSRSMDWVISVLNVSQRSIEARWSTGAYTGGTFDETAQLNAKALGASAQIRNILNFIDQIKHGDVETKVNIGDMII